MARRRRNNAGETRLDQMIALYMDMTPEERSDVRAALKGCDAGIGKRQPKAPAQGESKPDKSEQAAFEELGERVAEE